MATLLDVVTLTLSDLGVLGAGETISAEDGALALTAVNDWIDSLATENLSVYSVLRTTWALTANVASYTVGSGGTINIDRPLSAADIQNIGYVDNSLTPAAEYQLSPVLTEDQYDAIVNKTLTNTYPAAFYYNPTNPLGTLKPWPVPTGSNLLGVLYAPVSVSEFTALSDTIVLPKGYRRYLRKSLAIDLAAAFHVSVTQELKDAASTAQGNVKRKNERLVEASLDDVASLFGGSGVSNIYTGT